MNDLLIFHQLIGKIVMLCQLIESDIKLIYAGMLKGDFDRNYYDIKKCSLGNVVAKLEKLDNSDEDPDFSLDDYMLLKDITKKRNHWCHQCYIEFVYSEKIVYSNEFREQKKLLEGDIKELLILQQETEKIRLEILKKYERIRT